MSRIRTIKPEFWTSEQVMECSPMARLMFIGLWNFCDDHGRHPASAKQIKALIFPADEVSTDTVRGFLDELSSNGLISYYVVDGKEYFEVRGWSHQKIDRPQPARFPAPIDEHSTNDRRMVSTEGKGGEGKGRDSTPDLDKSKSVSSPAAEDATTAEIINLESRKAKAATREASDMDLLDEVTDLWNTWARAHGSPLVERLTKPRASKCRHRIDDLKKYGHSTAAEAFNFLLSKCNCSFFARGSPKKPLEFDQLMSEGFMTRMLEGAFEYRQENRKF